MSRDGDAYQARFDRLAASGLDVHGEASFVASLEPAPTSVLDAGCGTGRVAIELGRRGLTVVDVDVDVRCSSAPDARLRTSNGSSTT
jgi:2-polyprenyl-3-methyl-5-hydroxy-6-metoxy-1,4-benzoquinol methylase